MADIKFEITRHIGVGSERGEESDNSILEGGERV